MDFFFQKRFICNAFGQNRRISRLMLCSTVYIIVVQGPLHVLWQVSFGCWVTWSISSWQEYYNSVFFAKAQWWKAKLLFLSLNNWGLNFLQNECSQSSQIYISPEKRRKMFTFHSCKFLNDKIKLPIAK
jgi:hypothetical protein